MAMSELGIEVAMALASVYSWLLTIKIDTLAINSNALNFDTCTSIHSLTTSAKGFEKVLGFIFHHLHALASL